MNSIHKYLVHHRLFSNLLPEFLFLFSFSLSCRYIDPVPLASIIHAADYSYESEEYIYELDNGELNQCDLFDEQQQDPQQSRRSDSETVSPPAATTLDNRLQIHQVSSIKNENLNADDVDDTDDDDDEEESGGNVICPTAGSNITIITANSSGTGNIIDNTNSAIVLPATIRSQSQLITTTRPQLQSFRNSVHNHYVLPMVTSRTDETIVVELLDEGVGMPSIGHLQSGGLEASIATLPTGTIFTRPSSITTMLPKSSEEPLAVAVAAGSEEKCICSCGKAYSTDASLRFHKYECGKEPSFQCLYCEYRAKRNTTLTKHMRSKHSMVTM